MKWMFQTCLFFGWISSLSASTLCPAPIKAGFDNWPPYHYHDKSSPAQVRGYAAEVLTAVLTRMGCEIEFRELPWKRILQEVKLGEVDMAMEANINDERTNRILGATNRVLLGEGVIRDKIHELEFEISPLSFFQNNPTQTDVLYSSALEYAELTGNETVFDIYCGIGTISLFLAGKAAKVVGIESVESAISDARRNAALNGIEHTEFHVGKAEQLMPELHAQGVTADVVVMDPPRKGCDKAVLQILVAMAPRRLVYVSCNPQTLARDLAWLVKQGFVLDEVQPVDMFPHSMHVEAVARLSLPAKA